MMILANAIDLPVVMIFGLVYVLPLTLLVTTAESLVFRVALLVPIRSGFRPLFVANVWSTLAGGVVHVLHTGVLRTFGMKTVVDLLHGYLVAMIVVILIYYVKSVAVEALILARRSVRQRTALTRSRTWQGVALANMATYSILGPVFYLYMRPDAGSTTIVDSPAEVVACDDSIYFVEPQTEHLCRIKANGAGRETVVPHSTEEFVVFDNGKSFACRVHRSSWTVYDRSSESLVQLVSTNQLHTWGAEGFGTIDDPEFRRENPQRHGDWVLDCWE